MSIDSAALSAVVAISPEKPAYAYRHVVSFEETNLVGNVYFTRHIAWQGRCREMFLRDNAPQILSELARDLRLVTLRVSCDYFEELTALDEIEIRMSLAHLRQHRIGLDFVIGRTKPSAFACVAIGFQEIGCMRVTASGLVAVQPPTALASALEPFAGEPLVRMKQHGGEHERFSSERAG